MPEKPERWVTRAEFYGGMSLVMFLLGLVYMNTSRAEDPWYRSVLSLVVGGGLILSGFLYTIAAQKSRQEDSTPPTPPPSEKAP
jgi:hypothetical protein